MKLKQNMQTVLPYRWLIGTLIVCLCLGSGWWWRSAVFAASNPVQAAWEQAKARGAYTFTSDLVQTTTPVVRLTSVGRTSRQTALHLEGATDLRAATVNLRLWSQEGSITDMATSVEVRVIDGKTQMRQGARPGEDAGQEAPWQDAGDLLGGIAPSGDFMAFLAGLRDLHPLGQEVRGGISFTRYGFQLDGPTIANHMREQIEDALRQRGELPAGLQLQAPASYAQMLGTGELWVDSRGLPLRQIFDVEFPAQNDEVASAHIVTDFANFAPPQAVAGLPPAAAHTASTSTFGLLLGLTCVAVVINGRRSRQLYTALVIALILAEVGGPLLQSMQINSFFAAQTARAAGQDQQQSEEALALRVDSLTDQVAFDPLADPLQSAAAQEVAQEAALSVAAAPEMLPVPTAEPLTAVDDGTDTDQDGLTDFLEQRLGTNPTVADTDGDQISDGVEVKGFSYADHQWFGDPLQMDSNNDGQPDTVEWHGARDGLPVDLDGDGTPDAFDNDNDGDGVPDAYDLSPYSKMTPGNADSSFNDASPFQLQLSNLQAGTPVFVDFQLRPRNEKHLWYALSVLDWPQDVEGQLQDGDGKTYADIPGSDLNASPADANGDMKLVPVLEIRTPTESANLASASRLRAYGVASHNLSSDGANQVIYVPLRLATDGKTGARLAFSGRMPYQASGVWNQPHQVRLVWLVQALLDSCSARLDGQCVTYAEKNQPEVIQSYYDDWLLTGLSVREDHGAQTALIFEDPTQDADLKDDAGLVKLAYGLEHSFLAGRDQEPNGQVDVTMANIDGAAARWQIPEAFQTVKGTYATFDDAVMTTVMSTTTYVLDGKFKAAWNNDHSIKPLLLFAHEESYRSEGLDGLLAGGTTEQQGALLKIDFNKGGTPTPVQTSVGLKWTLFCGDAQSGQWQSCSANTLWDELYSRYAASARLTLNGQSDSVTAGQARLGLIRLYFFALAQGVVNVIKSDATVILPSGGFLRDDELSGTIRGAGAAGKGVVALITSLATTKFELLSNDIIRQIARLGAPKLVASLGVGGFIRGNVVTKLKALWSQSTGAKIGLVGGIVGVILITLALVSTLAYFLATDPALRDSVVGVAVGKVVPIVGIIVPLAGLAAATVPLVQLAKALAGAQGALPKLLRGSSALAGTSRISVAVGAVIQLGVVWGIFIYQMVSTNTPFFSPQFNAALAQVIAATVIIVTLAVLSATVIGLLIVGVIALVDAILTAICELGVDDLRKVPGLNGACFTLNTAATAGLAKLIYSFDSMINTDRDDLVTSAGPTFTLADPARGFVTGNPISINLGVTTTVVHKDPKPENAMHMLPYIWLFSDDNIRGTTFKYELAQSGGNVDAQRHQMDSAWTVSADHLYAGKTMYRAQASMNPQVNNINLPVGINQAPTLYLNTGYALPAYECWSTLGLAHVCYVRTLDGHNSTKIDQLKLDILPASLDAFMATVDAGGGAAKLGWDSHFTILADADGDGLRTHARQGNDPNDATWDADGDGLSDALELAWRAGGIPASPLQWDSDGDGLTDAQELNYGTDPTVGDTDNDGLNDGDEIYHQVYAFDAASGTAKPTGAWAGGWTVAIPGAQPFNLIVSSDPTAADGDQDGISDRAEKELATNADPALHLDPDGRPYHPLLVNTNPVVVQVAVNDADGVVKPGQALVYSTTVTNLGAPLAAGGLEVRAPATLGAPYSTYPLSLDQANSVTQEANFIVATVPSQQLGLDSFARVRLVNPNPTPWTWGAAQFGYLGDATVNRFGYAAVAPSSPTQQKAFAVTAVNLNLNQVVNSPGRDLNGGDVDAWGIAEGAFAPLDQDGNNTTALKTASAADVACNATGRCLYVWDHYLPTGAVQRNVIAAALTGQNPTSIVRAQFTLTENPAATGVSDFQPAVASDGTNFLVAWERVSQDANTPGVMYSQLVTRLFNANGDALGSEQVFGKSLVSSALGWRAYMKLDVAWLGQAYRVARHQNSNLDLLDFNSTNQFFGADPIATNVHANSWPRLAYNPITNGDVVAYVDDTLQMHIVFFDGLNGGGNNATFGEVYSPNLEIAYHPGSNDWLVAWPAVNTRNLTYTLLKPDGVTDFTLGRQEATWPVQPVVDQMNLACPAATSQPVLTLPFEELPGATAFADTIGRAANLSATCAAGHCPLPGAPGAPQAPNSDYGVRFDATKQQKLTVPVPGINGDLFSIAFWYKIDGHDAMTLAAGDGWFVASYPGILYFKTANGGLAQANAATDDGQWHHVVVADNHGFATLYLDGVQKRATNVDHLTLPVPTTLTIGSAADNSGYFNGTIDQLAVYAAALDAGTVDDLYHRRLDSACLVVAPALNTFKDDTASNDVGMVETARLPLLAQDVRGGLLTAGAGLSLTVDADAPTSDVDSLADGSYVAAAAGGKQMLIIGGSANDAHGIQQVNVSVNGGAWQPAGGGATWVFPLQLQEGRYALQSQAIDAAGNVEVAPRTTTLFADGSGPQITTAFNDNATMSPLTQNVGQWALSLQGTVSDPAISGNPGSGVQQIDVLLQSVDLNASGNGWQSATLQGNNWSVGYTLAAPPALTGSYSVTVRASDRVGNGTTLVRHLVLDGAGPEAALSGMDATRSTLAPDAGSVKASSAEQSVPFLIKGTAADVDGVAAVDVAFVPIQRIRAISDTLIFLPFDEAPGESVYHDLSPLHTDVSCVRPCIAGEPGRSGQSVHMTPKAGPVERPNFGEFDFASHHSFSVQGWVRTSQKDGVILSKEDLKNAGFALVIAGGKVVVRLNNQAIGQSDKVVNDGQWHQVAAVYDGTSGELLLYLDGAIAAKGEFNGALFDAAHPNSPLVIGGKREQQGYSGQVDAWFDDVGVFDVALSPFLVQALYSTETTHWQAATLKPAGAVNANWRVAVPAGLEGQYQIDLRTLDKLGNQSLHASAWRGVIDNVAPRILFTMQPSGERFDEGNGTIRYETVYSYTVEDRYLSDKDFSGPCSEHTITVRDFAGDADMAGLFPDLTLRNRLSASCVVWENSEAPTTTVTACDLMGLCAGALPTLADKGQAASISMAAADEPGALLLNPTNHSIVAFDVGQILPVTFVAHAEAGLRTVEIIVDDKVVQQVEYDEKAAIKSAQQTVNVELPFDDADKAEGEHTIVARASDWAGSEQRTLFPSTVTLDTHDPVVDLLNDKLTAADGYGLGNSTMRLHGSASDNFGLAAVQISVNEGPFADVTFDDQGTWSTALWLGDEAGGQKLTFALKAIDRAGHQSTMSKEVLVDVPALATLQTTIDAAPTNPTEETTATFRFSGVDAQGNALTHFQCQLDGDAFTPCTSPQSYSALSQGEHIFRVLSNDGQGNIDPTPAELVWQIGNTPPPVTSSKSLYLPAIANLSAAVQAEETANMPDAMPQANDEPDAGSGLTWSFYLPLVED